MKNQIRPTLQILLVSSTNWARALLFILLGLIVVGSILVGIQIGKNDSDSIRLNYSNQIINILKTGQTVKKINNPSLKLPPDINEAQILNYFQLDNVYFALVMQNSMNVVLNTPKDYNTIFAGVLVSKQGDIQWVSFAEIKDKQANNKNNPYYLWTDSNKLMLSVVDQNGAGSGEGIMKLFVFSGNGDWELKGCYYFGGTYSDPSVDGDYFAYSSILSKQTPNSLNECNNVIITSRK